MSAISSPLTVTLDATELAAAEVLARVQALLKELEASGYEVDGNITIRQIVAHQFAEMPG